MRALEYDSNMLAPELVERSSIEFAEFCITQSNTATARFEQAPQQV